MAHPEQREFVESVKAKFPSLFHGKRVLECGSLNINGTIRDLFTECDYTGIDLGMGPCVDVVYHTHLYHSVIPYDIVCSTEMFEHDQHWQESFINMIQLCKPKGLIFFTCATEGRAEHGTRRTSPMDSPFTCMSDYYRNLTQNDFLNLPIDWLTTFKHFEFTTNEQSHDLYFCGIKA